MARIWNEPLIIDFRPDCRIRVTGYSHYLTPRGFENATVTPYIAYIVRNGKEVLQHLIRQTSKHENNNEDEKNNREVRRPSPSVYAGLPRELLPHKKQANAWFVLWLYDRTCGLCIFGLYSASTFTLSMRPTSRDPRDANQFQDHSNKILLHCFY